MLEVNLGIVEVEKFVGFCVVGVNCLLFGIQSFNDEYLKVFGCIYGVVEVKCVV